MSHSNVIIVHGAYSYPTENWFDWLRIELEHLNIPCIVPALPTPEHQTLENWHQSFDAQCGHLIDAKTILIGHDLGATYVLRWLEKSNQKIDLAVLVGVFINKVGIPHFDLISKSFVDEPFDWNKIKSNANEHVSYHGDNDPYISRPDLDFICESLHACKMIIANAGHINLRSGYSKFPLLLSHLEEFLQEKN